MRNSRFRYFSRNRKLQLKCFLVFLGGFLCLSLAVSVQCGLWQTRLETAREQYGLWQGMRLDVNEADSEILKNHQLLTCVGTEEIYGALETEGESFLMGSADDSFWELARFHLIQGALPETGEEILVETQVLDRLGLSYDPGQTITGNIQNEERTFTVAGVIDNYSALWISSDRQPAVFAGPGTGLQPVSQHMFVRGTDPRVMDDLKQAMPLPIRNIHVQELWNPFSPENAAWTVLMAAALGGSGFLILTILHKWLDSHRHDLLVMKSLGVSSRKLFRDMVRLMIRASCVASLMALVPGLVMHWPWKVMLITAAIMAGETAGLCLLLYLEISRIPTVVNASAEGMARIPKSRKPMKKVTPGYLGLRFMRSQTNSLAVFILTSSLLAGALTGSVLSLTETWQYETWLQEKPDFLLSLDPPSIQTFEVNDVLKDMVEKLEEDNRFKDVASSFVQAGGWMMPVRQNSVLEQIRKDSSIRDFSRSTLLFPSEKPDWQRVSMIERQGLDLSQVENLDRELWESGEGVILYAPDFSVQDGDLWLAEDLEDPPAIMKETGYKTGDTIELMKPDGERIQARIAGILRKRMPEMWFDELLSSCFAYTFFAGPGFLDYPVNRVHVRLNDDVSRKTAGVSLAAMAHEKDVYLSNESAVKQQGMELFNSEETMYGVLVCILFLALIWVQFHGLTNLQTALADFCHRLILAGSGTRAAEKAGALVRWMVCICLLMGTLGFSLLICWIHLRFPVNETLLRMIFPFLFIQQNPVGILRLDVQIGLWLIPLVLLGEGLLATGEMALIRKRRKT